MQNISCCIQNFIIHALHINTKDDTKTEIAILVFPMWSLILMAQYRKASQFTSDESMISHASIIYHSSKLSQHKEKMTSYE